MVELHLLVQDIVGTRICHANADTDTDADTNGIRTETDMSALTFGGGHKYLKRV